MILWWLEWYSKPHLKTTSELSAVGAKWDVENTPKPTRLTVSLPQDGFGLVRLKYCSPSEQNPKCMFVEQSYFQGQLCYALNIDVKIFQLCIPIWLCGLDRTIEHVVNLLWHWGTTSCASKQSNIEIRTQINSSLLLDLPKSNQIALWGKFTLKTDIFTQSDNLLSLVTMYCHIKDDIWCVHCLYQFIWKSTADIFMLEAQWSVEQLNILALHWHNDERTIL